MPMDEPILNTVKSHLGIYNDDTSFDRVLITHINSVFSNLTQLGVGPAEGYHLLDGTETWSQYPGISTDTESIRTYMCLKVALVFDPPQMGYLVDAIKEQIKELEWRLNVQVETVIEEGG